MRIPRLCRRGSGGPGRSAWPLLAAAITAVVLVAAGCSSSAAPAGPAATAAASTGPANAVNPPNTPAVPTAGPVPATWAGLDSALRSVAPQVRLLVANVSNGSCQPAPATEAGRRALLASTVDRLPLPDLAAARALNTRALGSLDFFASATDICRAYASLAALARRPGLSPIGQVLSLNDAGLDLDPARWKTTWYKGGYEPRAWTLAYLATTRTGQSYVVTVLTENPSQLIDVTTAPPVLLAAIKGAFTLAARS